VLVSALVASNALRMSAPTRLSLSFDRLSFSTEVADHSLGGCHVC
jgi:hypothetical protein